MKDKKSFKKRIKRFYKELDDMVNIKEQIIGWSSTIITLLIGIGIIKLLSIHPEWIISIKLYFGVPV